MSRRPRTPVHFPRMRVRGARNRQKVALRRETKTVLPFARLIQSNPFSIEFSALAAWEPGAYRLESSVFHDGYGRQVGSAKVIAAPAPVPDGIDKMDALLYALIGVKRPSPAEGDPPDAT